MNIQTTINSEPLGASPEDWALALSLEWALPDLLPIVCDPSVPISRKSALSCIDGKTPSAISSKGEAHGIKAWTERRAKPDEINLWQQDDRIGIGLRCTNAKAFDIDVDDPALAKGLKDYLLARIEAITGHQPPVRHRHNSPRCVIAVRCSEPLLKRVISVEGGAVEFLGDKQQFFFAGTHKSGARCEWDNADYWPVLSSDQLLELLDELEMLFSISDTELSGAATSGERADPADLIPRSHIEDIKAAVSRIENDDLHYDQWLKVGMGCHYESGGTEAGYEIWLEWSEQSPKHDPSQMLAKWASFGCNAGRPVTLGTLKAMGSQTAASLPDRARTQPHLWLRPASELIKGVTPPRWVIKGIFEEKTLGMIHGQPATGKSFITLDIALYIATGRKEWHGHAIRQNGAVAYLAGEGHGGLRRRLAAWADYHKERAEDVRLYVSSSGIDLNAPQGFADACDAIRALPAPPVLVIVDTLHRFLNGDENSAQDARGMIDACGRLQEEFGCSVVLVHHTGVSAEAQERGRGSSAWKGALDWEFSVKSVGAGRISMTNKKSKDSAAPEDVWFKLEDAPISGLFDEEGAPVKSAVIERIPAPVQISPEEQRCAEYVDWVKRAYLLGGEELKGEPYLGRTALLHYLVTHAGLTQATAEAKLRPSRKDGLVKCLSDRRVIEQREGGWAIIDASLLDGLFDTKGVLQDAADSTD